jgi:bifunctional polynucleotide phosphatase/kinase
MKDASGKNYDAKDLISKRQEVIICVGMPASGKSSFTKKIFEPNGYVRVNQDTLKTKEKCVKACQVALDQVRIF